MPIPVYNKYDFFVFVVKQSFVLFGNASKYELNSMHYPWSFIVQSWKYLSIAVINFQQNYIEVMTKRRNAFSW